MNTAKSGNIPETYEFPLYLFYQGKNSEAYKFFGVLRQKIITANVIAFVSGLRMQKMCQ